MSNLLEVRNLEKHYGEFRVLSELNLSIQEGEVLAILGPSGSGKSTFIRILNLLEAPDQGEIHFNGQVITPTAPRDHLRQRIGMIFQNFNLFSHLTVLENLTLAPIRVKKLSSVEAQKLAMSFLDRMGLGDQASKYPHQLSGGQQQRVAIARALAMKPDLLLFDEPTSALDPEATGDIFDIIQDLAREGMTMIVVTHDINFARHVADRIAFFDQGKILHQAPSETFFTQIQHERIRTFLRRWEVLPE